MKRLFILTSLLLLLTAAGIAQDRRLNSAPQSFRSYFATFKKAVSASDKVRVADMTNFPFEYGFDAGDEGKMTRKQFIRRFNEVFGTNPRRFITERNPIFSRGENGSYTISTEDAAHLAFKKTGRTYRFTHYIVEP